MFESSSLPRKANKPVLADTIWELSHDKVDENDQSKDLKQLPEKTAFILDGGALLQCVPWKPGLTFDELCLQYVEYISKWYHNVTIVFDGYKNGPSIKDAIHRRRTAGKSSVTVTFTGQMVNKVNKDKFLAN